MKNVNSNDSNINLWLNYKKNKEKIELLFGKDYEMLVNVREKVKLRILSLLFWRIFLKEEGWEIN